MLYEACIQYTLGDKKSWKGKIQIYEKGKAWVRDTEITGSMWSDRDFIFHGWKNRYFFRHNYLKKEKNK